MRIITTIVIALLLAVSNATAALPSKRGVTAKVLNESEYESLFGEWMARYRKAYASSRLVSRFNVWKSNFDMINAHNAENASYELGMNAFGDLTNAEFVARHNGYRPELRRMVMGRRLNKIEDSALRHLRLNARDLPTSIDWRDKGAVTSIKDQGNCGSCYTFSAVGAIEGAMGVAGLGAGGLVSLSTQQLLDCTGGKYGNLGCNGGFYDSCFQFANDKKGICADASYPYTGKKGRTCKSCSAVSGSAVKGFVDVPSKNESALLAAVAQGPTSVAVQADGVFQFYKSGVFDNAKCGTNLDHAVLAVGYGTTDDGTDFWIIKNSWTEGWGESGFMRMIRGKNMCGINLEASYPLLGLRQDSRAHTNQ